MNDQPPLISQAALVAALLTVLPQVLPGALHEQIVKAAKQATVEVIRDIIDPLKDEVTALRRRVDYLENHPPTFSTSNIDDLERLEKKIADVEDRSRRNNIVITNFGFRKCHPMALDNDICAFINSEVGEFCVIPEDIIRAHFLGRSNHLIVRFHSWKLQQNILFHARYSLQGARWQVKENFSVRTRNARAAMYPLLNALRGETRKAGNNRDPQLVVGQIYKGDACYSWHMRRQCFEKRLRDGRMFRMPASDGERIDLGAWEEISPEPLMANEGTFSRKKAANVNRAMNRTHQPQKSQVSSLFSAVSQRNGHPIFNNPAPSFLPFSDSQSQPPLFTQSQSQPLSPSSAQPLSSSQLSLLEPPAAQPLPAAPHPPPPSEMPPPSLPGPSTAGKRVAEESPEDDREKRNNRSSRTRKTSTTRDRSTSASSIRKYFTPMSSPNSTPSKVRDPSDD